MSRFLAGGGALHEAGHTLYVVTLSGSGPDCIATEVTAAFAQCGFRVAIHAGPASVADVLKGVRSSDASTVLLCEWRSDVETRALVKALKEVVEYVIAVGDNSPDTREGDPGEPFLVHPDEGADRFLWVARFVSSGLSGSAPN